MYYESPARVTSHYCHLHKTSHHGVILSDEMSLSAILERDVGVNVQLGYAEK